MPFFALVNAAGETVRVVTELPDPVPDGLIAVELPAPGERVRLGRLKFERGGGAAAHEAQTERDAAPQQRDGLQPAKGHTAEQFFSRLELELRRARQNSAVFSVLLFDLAPVDRPRADAFCREVLRDCGHELLPVDYIAPLRPHLTGVLLRDVDTGGAKIDLVRGACTTLRFPNDRKPIEALLSRRHPLLFGTRIRAEGAPEPDAPAA
jgi:hypothetical protein